MVSRLLTMIILTSFLLAILAITAWIGQATAQIYTLNVTTTAIKGRMVLGTRGFARTSASTFTNLEGESLFRIEVPYGAASGWKLTYQGFSDGTTHSILILGVGVWIQQASGEPITRRRLTFSASNTLTIAHDTTVESDGVTEALLPGARVWVATWYKTDSPSTVGLPYQQQGYGRELEGAGTESNDGALSGAVGTLTDHTLTGGFDHSALGGPLNAGLSYLIRIYQPMCLVGNPHPSYVGQEFVPFWIGDSINVFNDDFNDDSTEWAMRGFSGRFCKNLYPFVVFGQSGSTAGGFITQKGTAIMQYFLGMSGVGRTVTHLIDEYGINNIRQNGLASSVVTDRQSIAAIALANGIPYIQTTLTPCGSGNLQGHALTNGFPAFIRQRAIFNDWVRANSDNRHLAGCIGYIDPCLRLETVIDNNVWASDAGGDLHPNSTGHQHYADTIVTSVFTSAPNPMPAASGGSGGKRER